MFGNILVSFQNEINFDTSYSDLIFYDSVGKYNKKTLNFYMKKRVICKG